jgi:hypothetical protein
MQKKIIFYAWEGGQLEPEYPPWLLDKKALEDLNDTINLIEEKINAAYLVLVDKKAELDLDEYKKREKSIDIEEAKQKVKESYSFSASNKFALIVTTLR